MTMTISSYAAELANIVSGSTSLDQNVILAHCNAEEGISSVNWPSNYPVGITPGNSAVDQLSTEVNPAGFDIFPIVCF